MKYRAVLFDAAETLFTTQGTVGEIYANVARKYGSKANAEDIQRAFKKHFQNASPLTTQREKEWWKELVRSVFLDVGMFPDFDAFFEEVYALFRNARGWCLFPETREVLHTLRERGVPAGIVSNFDSRLYSVLSSLRIASYFKSVTISSEAGYAKPDPRIFLAAARSLAAPPERVVIVGDSLFDDYRGGQAAGLYPVLIDRKNRHAGVVSLNRITDLREVLPLLGGV